MTTPDYRKQKFLNGGSVRNDYRKQGATFHRAQLAYQSQPTISQLIFTQKPTVCYKLVLKIISHLLPKNVVHLLFLLQFIVFSQPSCFSFSYLLVSLFCFPPPCPPMPKLITKASLAPQQEVTGNLQSYNFTRQ